MNVKESILVIALLSILSTIIIGFSQKANHTKDVVQKQQGNNPISSSESIILENNNKTIFSNDSITAKNNTATATTPTTTTSSSPLDESSAFIKNKTSTSTIVNNTKVKKPYTPFYPIPPKENNTISTKPHIKIKVEFMWQKTPTNRDPHCLIYDLLQDTFDIEYSENPDFWFFTASYSNRGRYKNCVKILFSGENVIPDFNKVDYAATFSNIDFGGRHCKYDFGFSKYLYKALENRNNETLNRNLTKRKFCNFIYRDSDQSFGGVVAREKFFKLLSEYKHVDSPGYVFNNMKDAIEPRGGNWQEGKLQFIKDYKFTIAFENTVSDGYTTEKLPDPLSTLSLPIYYGNPRVGLEYNKKAFIHVNDYDSLEDAVKKVIELDNDDDAYMKMLSEPPLLHPERTPEEELKQFLIGIINKGNKQYHKNELGLKQ